MSNVKEERKKDAENGRIYELISRKSIIDKSAKKPYVFISYSSKDWFEVLHEIVYELCMKKACGYILILNLMWDLIPG